jgi:hypothetical protein
MITPACREMQDRLEAFVDGELSGRDRLAVTSHLDGCNACGAEVDALRNLGASLRAEVPVADVTELHGLAGGVISRVLAEQAQSWHSLFRHAFDDWRWVMVGGGSLLGTLSCAVFVISVLLFGPIAERGDSLAARLSSSDVSAGTLFVVASPRGDQNSSIVMQFEGSGDSGVAPTQGVVPSAIGTADESALTQALSDAITRGGRLVDLNSLSASGRLYVEGLLDDIGRRHLPSYGASGQMTVHQLWLATSTSVSAKAL